MDKSGGYKISKDTYDVIDNILHYVWALDDIKGFYNKIKIHKFDTTITDRIFELGQIAHSLFLDLSSSFNQNEKSSNFRFPREETRRHKNEIDYCIYTQLPRQDRDIIEKDVYEKLTNHMLFLRDLTNIGSYLEKHAKKVVVRKSKKFYRKRLSNKKDSFEDYEPLKIKSEHTYGDFKVYSDFSIKYKSKNIELPLQKLKILDLFLSRNGKYIQVDTIIKYLESEKKTDAKRSSYIKYLTPIKKALKEVTGKEWITRDYHYGWVFILKNKG